MELFPNHGIVCMKRAISKTVYITYKMWKQKGKERGLLHKRIIDSLC